MILDPIPLPKEVKRGQTHHIATECRADRVEVWLDGQKIYDQRFADRQSGGVGFRAAGSAEQGLIHGIALRKL